MLPKPTTTIAALTALASALLAAGVVAERLVLAPALGALAEAPSISAPSIDPVGRAHHGPKPGALPPSSVWTPDVDLVPDVPPENGLAGAITDRRIAGEDRDTFYLAIEANRRTESGSTIGAFSALRTTAGRGHHASYGVAQLTIHEHLERLATLDARELESLGIRESEIATMRNRGDAASAWFRVLVDGVAASSVLESIGLTGDEAALGRSLVASRNSRLLLAMVGRRFADSTGLGREALIDLIATRALRGNDVREAFRALYMREHRVPFDASHRDGSRIAITTRRLVDRRPELREVLSLLGDDSAGHVSLGHYVAIGDVAENLYGWHARAAQSAVGRERMIAILRIADPITTRLRELANFVHAMAAVIGVTDLRGLERARMLARIARCFHGAPGRARTAFFFGGDLQRPRATTAAELESAIQEYRLSRAWSDARLQRAFDEVVAERGSR